MKATPISLSALKPPMPGPCPARGSTTTNGRRRRIDLDSLRRHDPDERIVDRPLEGAAVDDELRLIIEHVRGRLGQMLAILVSALSHHVPEQDGALRRVGHVLDGGRKCPGHGRGGNGSIRLGGMVSCFFIPDFVGCSAPAQGHADIARHPPGKSTICTRNL